MTEDCPLMTRLRESRLTRARGISAHTIPAAPRAVRPPGVNLTPWATAFGILISVLLIGACVPDQPRVAEMPTGWAAGPSEVIEPTDKPRNETDYFDRFDDQISLRGAVNETLAFEFVLNAADTTFSGVELSVEGFVGPAGRIPADAVRIYRHWSVVVDRFPNWYLRSTGLREPRRVPDALVPIDAPKYGQPFSIPRGENLVFWVEVQVPPSTNVGKYTGAIIVTSSTGGIQRNSISLEVLDLFLDLEQSIPVITNVQLKPLIRAFTSLDADNPRIYTDEPEARRLITDTFKLLHDHGLTPVTTEIGPRLSQDLDGTLVLDWTDYDNLCAPLIDGSAYDDRRPAEFWPLPVDLRQPDPLRYGGLDTTTYSAILKEYLVAVADHFRENGRLDRAYVYFEYPPEVSADAVDYNRVRRFATLTHLADANLPFVSRLIPQSMAPFGWFGHHYEDLHSLVDIWSTPARYQHPSTLRKLQTLGKRTWLLPDRPPYSGSIAVEAPPVHTRSLPWQANLQGHSAIMIDHATDWPPDVLDAPIRKRRQASDTWLVYPGKMFGLPGPIPSVRLKQLQIGLQDYMRLRLLQQNGRVETARLIAGSLIKAAGTDAYGDNYQDGLLGRRIDQPSTWELARRILDDEVQLALQPFNTTLVNDDVGRLNWIRFLEATRSIQCWPESARLRISDRSDDASWIATFEVGVRSEIRTPLEGELYFGGLPQTMTGISDKVRIGPLPEMGLARERLLARCAPLPATDLDGHTVLPVIFDAKALGQIPIAATLAIVQAPQAPFPITIDGRLDDWPQTAFNAAGDFRLITDRAGLGRERPRAQSQTIAYFLQSHGTFYIGIHAGTPEKAPESTDDPTPFQNFVDYEDLMPIAEDLVEIILDPSNKGTQSGDLYHIVLKSTGNPRFERGIGTRPPIDDVKPWPGALPQSCVIRTEYGWSAEVAIPIASLGEHAAANRVWGLNLTRLEPTRGEYSDWARVPRHAYDPRALGNLVWPD